MWKESRGELNGVLIERLDADESNEVAHQNLAVFGQHCLRSVFQVELNSEK